MLRNELLITKANIENIFKTKEVFVFGYGSLLFSDGWKNRHMKHKVGKEDLIECTLNGYQRGPYGIAYEYGRYSAFHNGTHYYGIVENKKSYLNGAITRIHTMKDWIGLMSTELIYGLYPDNFYNYRAVDITDQISGIKLKKNQVVHVVANEAVNAVRFLNATPAKGYYEYVSRGIKKERTEKFIRTFYKTGGINA